MRQYGDRVTLTRAELLEVVHRYLERAGHVDSLDGIAFARRIDQAGGPGPWRARALADLDAALEAAAWSPPGPATSEAALRTTWRRRYGVEP